MNNKMNLLPRIALWCLLALSAIVVIMFFVGGSSEVVINGETWAEPTFTNLLLIWAYALAGVALLIVVVASVISFVKNFIDSPIKGVKTLCVLIAFVAVFVIAWACGSTQRLDIIGYEGTDNVGTMARFSDMMCYTAYVLICAAILSIAGSMLYSKLKK